jgi:hypothetical protein
MPRRKTQLCEATSVTTVAEPSKNKRGPSTMFASRRAGNRVIKTERTQLCNGTEAQMTEDSADGAREYGRGHEPQAPLVPTEKDLQRCAVEKDAESVANLNRCEV